MWTWMLRTRHSPAIIFQTNWVERVFSIIFRDHRWHIERSCLMITELVQKTVVSDKIDDRLACALSVSTGVDTTVNIEATELGLNYSRIFFRINTKRYPIRFQCVRFRYKQSRNMISFSFLLLRPVVLKKLPRLLLSGFGAILDEERRWRFLHLSGLTSGKSLNRFLFISWWWRVILPGTLSHFNRVVSQMAILIQCISSSNISPLSVKKSLKPK